MKILVTCFEPFGLGKIINRNESKVIAEKIKEKYRFEVLVLPVNKYCTLKLIKKISKYKPQIIVCLGEGPELRIETKCHKKNKEKVNLNTFLLLIIF